ncbi:MAG: alpha/beta fold hydrolase [Rhodomicrobium sp.]
MEFSAIAAACTSATFPAAGQPSCCSTDFRTTHTFYDDLIPHLAQAGRRTVSIDFLGFGASDKPEGAHYSFEQQLGDLEAVVEALALEKIIPAGHDAGGPAAVNFALKHPERAAAVCLMNAFYGDAPGLRVPELTLREQRPEISHPAFLGESAGVRVAACLSARPNAGGPNGGTESPLP